MRVLSLPCLVLALTASGCCEFSGPRWHGRRTDHFDGTRFHNQIPGRAPGEVKVLRWRLTRRPGRWPRFAALAPAATPVPRVPDGALRVTMINHATVLLQLDGHNLLTDPIWGEVAGPTHYLGSARHRPPGLRLDDLPPIDAVLLSHDHYDHLDAPTLRELDRRFSPTFVGGLGMGALLARMGLRRVVEMDWWQWTAIGKLRVHAVPARHGCRRGGCDEDARLWVGFVVDSPFGAVYFAGDTGYGPHFQQIAERAPPLRLALLPIAPGSPRALFGPVHLDAKDAVLAARILGAQVNVPIHFGTFAQGDEADGDAEATLRGLTRPDDSPPFPILHNGEALDVEALDDA